MKKTMLLLLGCCLCMVSCHNNPKQTTSKCQVEVTVDFPEYSSGCLRDENGKLLDSLKVSEGKLAFERTDSTAMPYIAIIHLSNPKDSLDWLDMPIVVESGTVQVGIGEYIYTEGTPLNFQLQSFLNELQGMKNSFTNKENLNFDEMREAFSEFYKQQILSNQNNVVGYYVFNNYGMHLNDKDSQQVKEQLNSK